MNAHQIDAGHVDWLAAQFMNAIKEHYTAHPYCRERVFEVLNALAATSAIVMSGCDETAREFFNLALEREFEALLNAE